jgi:signal transduction histidine kinase
MSEGGESGAQAPDSGLLRDVRWRLVAWSAGLTLLVILALGAALYGALRTSLTNASVDVLQGQADLASEVLEAMPSDRLLRLDTPPGTGAGLRFGEAAFGGAASGTLALIVDPDGEAIGPLQPTLTGLPLAEGVAAAMTSGEDLREVTIDGTPLRVLSTAIDIGGEPYVLQIAQDRTADERTLGLLLAIMAGGAVLAVALAVGLGFVYAGRALVPIRASFRRQRDFAADASHELRTPLAVLRVNVGELRRGPERRIAEVGDVVDDIDAEVQQLTTLVDQLLLLARSDSGAVELRHEALDLTDVADDALRRLGDLAASRAVELRLDGVPAPMQGDPDRLAQLVSVLADNAIRHSPPGGTVTVSIGLDEGVRLVVEDEGPGIRDEDLPRLFDRFWRAADAPPGGSGLGLAIAAWIAEHHRGRVTAANRPSGGARFEVRLPAG